MPRSFTVEIPLETIGPIHRPQADTARRVGSPWLFAGWMGIAAATACLVGIGLGLLAALELGPGATHWTPVVQVHGRIQLYAFAAAFTTSLLLEFVPRLYSRPALSPRQRIWPSLLLATGALISAAGQLGQVRLMAVGGGGLSVLGAALLALAIVPVCLNRSLRRDRQPLFLLAAVTWLLAASVLSVLALADSEEGVLPLATTRISTELFLRGFILNTVLAVALRAFPGHLDLEPVSPRRTLAALLLVNGALVLWLAGAGPLSLPANGIAQRTGDIAFACSLLVVTRWIGVPAPTKARGGPLITRLVSIAWSGLIVYAALLAFAAVWEPRGDSLSLYQTGAIRHVFVLGFMLPLMVAMAHIVLARFGTGRLAWQPLLTAGFVLVVAAWPLRVVPALVETSPGPVATGAITASGILVIGALAMVAGVCFRTARDVRTATIGAVARREHVD